MKQSSPYFLYYDSTEPHENDQNLTYVLYRAISLKPSTTKTIYVYLYKGYAPYFYGSILLQSI
jgi:hypothetical protein